MHFPGPFTKDPGSWCEVSGPLGLIRPLPRDPFYGSFEKGSPPQRYVMATDSVGLRGDGSVCSEAEVLPSRLGHRRADLRSKCQ